MIYLCKVIYGSCSVKSVISDQLDALNMIGSGEWTLCHVWSRMLGAGRDGDMNADGIQMSAFGHEHVRQREGSSLIKCRATYGVVAGVRVWRFLPGPTGICVPSAAWLFSIDAVETLAVWPATLPLGRTTWHLRHCPAAVFKVSHQLCPSFFFFFLFAKMNP